VLDTKAALHALVKAYSPARIRTMRETDEIQTDAPGHCRRHDRQCARVVRLCDALGYLMRPVGGALIGHIGDRFGRRAT